MLFFYGLCLLFLVNISQASSPTCEVDEIKFDKLYSRLFFFHPKSVYPDNDRNFDRYCSLLESSKPLFEKVEKCSDPIEKSIIVAMKGSVDKVLPELCAKKKYTTNLFKCTSKEYRKLLIEEGNKILGLFTLAAKKKTKEEAHLYTCCISYFFKHKVSRGNNPKPSGCSDKSLNVTETFRQIFRKEGEDHLLDCHPEHSVDNYQKCIDLHPEVHSFILNKKNHNIQAGSDGQRFIKSYYDIVKKQMGS